MIKARNSIELPQIVVVGAQSAGKSSVLESIVGRDFLPRGSGIVTRCPLVLQLKHIDPPKKASNAKDQLPEEYAEFLHKEGQIFKSFDLVRREIVAETERVAGTDKGISEQPISLKIYSPNVVDLTLVDLPGLTKVPVKGQPTDIEQQIRRLIMRFVRSPNALILALSAANQDLANSDSLQLAREVDPLGDRTIGVVTKIDLMDEGTDAIETLQGKVYPLKLGYFGVKCRSQKQIDDNIPIREAIEIEAEFFSRHHVYSAYSNKMGVPYLTRSLNRILVAHIQRCIPNLAKQITTTIQTKERELLTYEADYMVISKESQGPIILSLISRFVEEYGKKLEGQFVHEIATECQGGARINYIFHKIFKNVVNSIDPFEYLSEQDIQTAIKNASAMSPSLFVPEGAFEVLIRQQIARLLEPSLECSQLVYEELRRLVLQIQLPELTRYYKLQSRIHDVMESVLNTCLHPTNEMILNLIEIETSLINTNHPDFIGSADSLLNLFQEQENQTVSAQDDDQTQAEEEQKTFSLMDKKPTTTEPISEPKPDEELNKSQASNKTEQRSSWMPSFLQRSTQKEEEEEQKNEQVITNEEKTDEVPQLGLSETIKHQFPQVKPTIDEHGNLPEVILADVPTKLRSHPHQESSRVIMETRVIQNLIFSYYGIVKKNIADLVPKTVMNFMVNESKRLAHKELVVKVYQATDLDKLLVEDPIVAANREACKQVIKALRTAQELLSEVTHYRI